MPYDDNFLSGVTVPLPTLLPAVADQAFDGGQPLEYTHHSIVFNEQRGLAIYAAHNVLSERVRPIKRKGFTLDPLVDRKLQIDNDRGYRLNPWDAGHLARRIDVHWPDKATAEQAERDTSRWTNIAPQHGELNQGPWKEIEDWLLTLADDNAKRMSVFTGPVFTLTDMEWTNAEGELPIRIPSGYWKIGLLQHAGQLKAAAFLIWQNDVHPTVDDFDPDDFNPTLEQVRVLTIEHLTGLSFGDLVRAADPLEFGTQFAAPTSGGGGFNTGGALGGPIINPPPPTQSHVSSITITGASDIRL